MLAVLVVGDGLAVGIVDVAQLFEIGVGVPAQDEVDVSCLADDGLVAHALLLPSEVGDADDEVAFLLLLEQCGHAAGGLYGVEVGYALAFGLVDEACHLGCQSEDADLHAFATDDDVGLDESFDGCSCEVVVGAIRMPSTRLTRK